MQEEQAGVLVHNLLDVFNERDASKRLSIIRDLYTEDGIFFEMDGSFTGYEAINQRVTEVLETLPPDAMFQVAGPMTSNHDLARLPWTLSVPDGAVVASGMDVGVLSGDRIERLY